MVILKERSHAFSDSLGDDGYVENQEEHREVWLYHCPWLPLLKDLMYSWIIGSLEYLESLKLDGDITMKKQENWDS